MRLEFIHDIELTIARWRSKLHLLDTKTAEILLALETSIQYKTNHQQNDKHAA
jgi:hypothetical protein